MFTPKKKLQKFVEGCSACGKDHNVKFSKLNTPLKIRGIYYTHIGRCNDKPLYMRYK